MYKILSTFGISRVPFAYAATSFSSAAMHNLFILYYVDLFLTVYKLDHSWFYFGETVFLFWNSFNDPLFGWLLTESPSTSQRGLLSRGRWNSIDKRLSAIKYGGVLWCLSFLFVFYPIPWLTQNPGIHFILCLCLYDTMLSFVLLSHSALLADISISTEERAKCNVYCSVMGAIGSNSVFLAHLFWDKTDLSSFRFYCLCVGIVALAGFFHTVSILKEKKPIIDISKGDDKKHTPSLRVFARQLLKWRNFWLFTGINLIQVFNCHFNSNFLSIFIKYFVSELAPFWHSVMLSLASLLPFAAVVYLAPRINKFGLYRVLQFLFTLKLGFGLFGLFIGSEATYLFFAFYLVFNKVFNETICRHGNLVVADLVDEDYSLNKRFISMSSAIYGANALFTKPGQSLAPMFGWYLLSMHGYTSIEEAQSTVDTSELRQMLFYSLVLVPIFCAIGQLVLWSRFTLKGEKLREVKKLRINSESDV